MIFTKQEATHVRRLPRYASVILVLLVVLHTVRAMIDFTTDWQYDIGPFSDIVTERTALAWLSSSMMLFAAVGCVLCYSVIERHKHHGYWLIMAGVMVYLSIDETLSLHERLNAPIRNATNVGGVFFWAWVIPGAIITGLFALTAIPFLRAIPAKPARMMLLGGVVFVTGAIGFEMIGADFADAGHRDGVWYTVLNSIEETLEASGMIIFLSAITWLLTSADAPRKLAEEQLAEAATD